MNGNEPYATCTTCRNPVFPHPFRHPITRETALTGDELQPVRVELTAGETAEHRAKAHRTLHRSGNTPVPYGTETPNNPNIEEAV